MELGLLYNTNGTDFLDALAEMNGWPFPADRHWPARQENTNPNP
jgi:hypothetical protein